MKRRHALPEAGSRPAPYGALRPFPCSFLHGIQHPNASPKLTGSLPCSRTFHGPPVGNRISSKLQWVRDSKSGSKGTRPEFPKGLGQIGRGTWRTGRQRETEGSYLFLKDLLLKQVFPNQVAEPVCVRVVEGAHQRVPTPGKGQASPQRLSDLEGPLGPLSYGAVTPTNLWTGWAQCPGVFPRLLILSQVFSILD